MALRTAKLAKLIFLSIKYGDYFQTYQKISYTFCENINKPFVYDQLLISRSSPDDYR
jgi:hypothetical protein